MNTYISIVDFFPIMKTFSVKGYMNQVQDINKFGKINFEVSNPKYIVYVLDLDCAQSLDVLKKVIQFIILEETGFKFE